MELYFIFLIIALFFVGLVLKSPGYKGKIGERKVIRKLGSLINRDEACFVFHDLTLKTPDGTTQIDHILLSPYGIFVIETKNMNGWIFGGEWQKKWVQVIYKKKTKFQNPIRQNYKHVKAIQQLLAANKNVIFSVVVFVGDVKFKTKKPDNVLKLKELLPFIRSHNKPALSRGELENYSSIIERSISEGSTSDKEHRKNVVDNRKNPLCPKCGSPMVLRVAQKGSNKGSKFWGCSKYPTCRGIKNAG